MQKADLDIIQRLTEIPWSRRKALMETFTSSRFSAMDGEDLQRILLESVMARKRAMQSLIQT